MKRLILPTLLAVFALSATAQRVTSNHDAAKMNQITVQETGAGNLTPDLYYTLLHNKYRKKASAENKMSFRTLAGISAYQQIDDAEKLDSAMIKRAEIEALNMADRQVDLAWLAEGKKIEGKLADFQRNINRIMTVGGTNAHKQLWLEHYNKFTSAVKAIKQGYMPNSQRKKEYLAIYADVAKANENLVKFLVHLNGKGETARLLAATYTKPDRKVQIAQAAMNRWRGSAWSNKGNNGGGNNPWVVGPMQPWRPVEPGFIEIGDIQIKTD